MAVVLVRGAGDVGSAVAHRLFRAGHAVVLHDRARPSHARRGMAFADALFVGRAELEGVLAKRAASAAAARRMLRCRRVVVVSDAPLESVLRAVRPEILVDARMRKRAVPEGQRGLAPFVIGLGPNFRAGDSVDVAIETAYGARLGSIVGAGATAELAGEPRPIGGHGRDRFVYAPQGGTMRKAFDIGDRVEAGAIVGYINEAPLRAPLTGWLRGIAHDGAVVEPGAKVVEVQTVEDAPLRGLGDRPRRIADGVLEAVARSAGRLPRTGRLTPLGVGAAIATLGGLIGLGGAEFRLPALVGFFRLGTRDAILANVAVSLVTVIAAFGFRVAAQGPAVVGEYWPQALNLLVGTLAGAWFGARLAASLRLDLLNRVIAVLLVALAIVIALHAWITPAPIATDPLAPVVTLVAVLAGFGIGIVSSLLGVAGGELLIPTLVLLYGIDIRLAGTVSLAISLPTLAVSLYRLARMHALAARFAVRTLVVWMACGSLLGALLGTLLLGKVDSHWLSILLAAVLALSAIRLFGHRAPQPAVRAGTRDGGERGMAGR